LLRTGDYRLSFYNKYGAHLRNIKMKGTSYTSTLESAEKFLIKSRKKHKKKGGDVSFVPVSYTVERRIFNSLDKTGDFA